MFGSKVLFFIRDRSNSCKSYYRHWGRIRSKRYREGMFVFYIRKITLLDVII